MSRVPLLTALLALGVRLVVLGHFPVMAYGDGWTRLAHAHEWTLEPWLPAYQVILHLVWLLDPGPLAPRLVTIALGALAAGLAARFDRTVGIAVAAAPILTLPGVMLYPESLALVGALGALATLDRPRIAAAFTALACLTRYEAWILAPLVALHVRRDPVAAILCVAPLPFLGRPDVAPIQLELSASRVVDQLRIWRGLVPWWIGPAVLIAPFGLLRPLPTAVRLLVAWAGLWALFVTFARPYAPPDNARQLVVPALAVAALAGRFPWLGLTVLLPGAWVYAAAVTWPHPTDVAALAREIPPGESVLVHDVGTDRHPGYPTPACEVVQALRPDVTVVCDHEPGGAVYQLVVPPIPFGLPVVARSGEAVLYRSR